MITTGIITDIGIDFDTRKSKISLLLDTKDLEYIEQLKKQNKLNIEIKKYRKKRSKDANSYFWKLLSEYSEEKEVDTIEEYKERVKALGIFRQFKIEKDNISTFEKMWTAQGIAWFCETFDTDFIGDTEFKIINAYYGSSSFNTKQMSRLINDLVEDCKEVRIETKPKEEIKALLKEWENVSNRFK